MLNQYCSADQFWTWQKFPSFKFALSEINRDVGKKTLNISSSLNLQKPFPKRICSQHVQLWKKKILATFFLKLHVETSSQNLVMQIQYNAIVTTDWVSLVRDACLYHYRWLFGKVPNGLWPPPLVLEKCCDFFQSYDDQHWICNEIFWIGNDPPPYFKVFPEIHDQKCSF